MARPKKTAEATADAPKLRTSAELDAAHKDALARLYEARKLLSEDGRHSTAVSQLNTARVDLRVIEDERADLRAIDELKRESELTAAQAHAQAAAHETAKRIPQRVVEQGAAFAEIVKHLEAVAALVEQVEDSQRTNDREIRNLPGNERIRGMLARAARTVFISRPLRAVLMRLKNTKLLDIWISVLRIPAEPDRNPTFKGETHSEARARVDALPQTAAAVYAETAQNVERLICELLGPAAEPTDPADITPWHGNPRRSGSDMTSAEANVSIGFDDSAQKRQAQRVRDSAKPIARDPEGKVVAAAVEAGEDLT